MARWVGVGAALVVAGGVATAAIGAETLKPELGGIAFLVGDWATPARGEVAETGGSSSGRSQIEPAVGGAVLLRRDHTDLFDASGKSAGGFDQIMMIYPEAGTLHADYSDGDHVIHYVTASVDPGRSVTFDSGARVGAPRFRLRYALVAPGKLDVAFSMAPPGSEAFTPVATGSLVKAP
jgi:hypothetical protein